MPDRLGYRAKIEVVVPSTNTTMEPELYTMAPHGVTFHIARLYLAQTAIGSAEAAQAVVQAFHAALEVAIRDVLTMEPDHLLIGVSALAFMGGVAGHARFQERLQDRNCPILDGGRSRSCSPALLYGHAARAPFATSTHV